MLKIIKDAEVFTPAYIGKKDILIANDRIIKIDDSIELPPSSFYEIEVIDASNQYLLPGFIDLHVHLIGGGGEGGYTTRTPEIQLSRITTYGVTTAVGLLGTDGTTRHLQSLIAKARALEEEGITTYLWSGCYQYPTRTLTNSMRDDIIMIDKIIGAGEIAISDHRGSHPLIRDIETLALECRVGGLLSGKCGILHLHVGDDKEGLIPLIEIISKQPILADNLLPTHINRKMGLLNQGAKYLKKGGHLDLTSGIVSTAEDPVPVDASQAFSYLLQQGCDPTKITMSSDSNGSMPIFDSNGRLIAIGVGSMESNLLEFRKMVQKYQIPIDTALLPLTKNPANILRLKDIGSIDVNFQADIILMNKDFTIDYVLCKGKTMVQGGKAVKLGTFESV